MLQRTATVPRRHRRPAWLGLILSLLMVTVMVPGTAAIAQTAEASKAWGQYLSGVTKEGSFWLGSLNSPSGTGTSLAWCIQAGATIPQTAGTKSAVRAPKLSYVLQQWSTSNFPGATRNQTHAAISYLVHSKYDIGSNGVSAASRRAATESATPAAIKKIANKMWGEAGDYAGDYAAKLTLTKVSAVAAKLTGLGITSDSNKWAPGYAAVITLSGPARFASGAISETFSTGTSAKSLNVVLIGTGKVTASLKVSGLPHSDVHRWTGGSTAAQDFFTQQEKSLSASDSISSVALPPTITTTASAISETTNTLVLKDTVKINADAAFAGQQVQLTARAYYHGTSAPSQTAGVPSSAEAVDVASTTVTLNASGDATWTTPNMSALKRSGYYTFVITSSEALAGLLPGSSTPYGVPVETVRWTPSPRVATTASMDAPDADLATLVRDSVAIAGMPSGTTITVRGQLWQHPQGETISQTVAVPSGAVKEGAEQVATVTTNASGAVTVNFSVKVPAKTYTADYTWVTTIDAIANVMPNKYVSPYGVATESVNIKARDEAAPFVSTQASTQVASPGASISDTFLINRNNADFAAYPLVLTSRLWHTTEEPVANQPITDVAGAQVVSEKEIAPVSDTDSDITVSNKNPFTVPSDPSLAGGWWVYTYSYAATGDWADDSVPEADRHDGYPGKTDVIAYATETVSVPWTPTVTTAATPAVTTPGKVGDTIADTVSVTGGKPNSDVEVALKTYVPTTTMPVQRTLDPTDTAGTPATVHTETVTVHLGADGAGTGVAEGFKATQPGYYPWTETITKANPGTEDLGAESDYGVPGELAVIAWQPAVTTNASHQVAFEGTPLSDDFTVSNLPPATTVDVVHTLYCSATEPVRSGTIPADATKVGTVTTTVTSGVDGTTTGRSDTIPATDCAYLVWTETIRATDPLILPWTSDYGIVTETTAVVSVTTQARAYAMVGTTTSDTAVISGPVPAGSVLYFDAYRQSDSDDSADDTLIGTVGPVVVSGPGSYDSPAVAVGNSAGKVYFRERLYLPGADGQIDIEQPPSVTGKPRLPGETTTVVRVSSTATAQAQIGRPFTDTAHLEGEIPPGTIVEFELHEQTGTPDEPLTENGYHGDTLLLTTEGVVTEGSGDVVSPEVTVDRVTTVYWVEKMYLPGQTEPLAMGQYRLANETTHVTLLPPPRQTVPKVPDVPHLAQTGATIWGLVSLAGGLVLTGTWAVQRRRRGIAD